MDYATMLALWQLYDKADSKQQKLLIYTFILLSLLRKNKRIYTHYSSYNKEETKEKQEEQQEEVINLLNKQYNQISTLIENSLIDSYQEAQKILNKHLEVNSSLTLQEIRHIVNETWVGTKNFKQRLSWNLGEIYNKYQELVAQEAEDWEFKKLQENYYYRLRRLLDTETHRNINQACLHAYRTKGVEFVEWVATMDERTCPVCWGRDKRVYPTNDAPFCPDHPFCRCLLIPSTMEDYNKWILANTN